MNTAKASGSPGGMYNYTMDPSRLGMLINHNALWIIAHAQP